MKIKSLKRKIEKALAMLLTVVMLMGIIPFSAVANYETPTDGGENSYISDPPEGNGSDGEPGENPPEGEPGGEPPKSEPEEKPEDLEILASFDDNDPPDIREKTDNARLHPEWEKIVGFDIEVIFDWNEYNDDHVGGNIRIKFADDYRTDWRLHWNKWGLFINEQSNTHILSVRFEHEIFNQQEVGYWDDIENEHVNVPVTKAQIHIERDDNSRPVEFGSISYITEPVAFPVDVAQNHWVYESLMHLDGLGFFPHQWGRYGWVRPDENMSRRDFAHYLAMVDGAWQHEINALPDKLDELSHEQGCCCNQRAIYAWIKGFMLQRDGKYEPWDPLTREELMYAGAVLLGFDPVSNTSYNTSAAAAAINDWNQIDDRYQTAVAYMYDLGFIHLSGNNFHPKNNIDRANIHAMISGVVGSFAPPQDGGTEINQPVTGTQLQYWDNNKQQRSMQWGTRGWGQEQQSPGVSVATLRQANALILEIEAPPENGVGYTFHISSHGHPHEYFDHNDAWLDNKLVFYFGDMDLSFDYHNTGMEFGIYYWCHDPSCSTVGDHIGGCTGSAPINITKAYLAVIEPPEQPVREREYDYGWSHPGKDEITGFDIIIEDYNGHDWVWGRFWVKRSDDGHHDIWENWDSRWIDYDDDLQEYVLRARFDHEIFRYSHEWWTSNPKPATKAIVGIEFDHYSSHVTFGDIRYIGFEEYPADMEEGGNGTYDWAYHAVTQLANRGFRLRHEWARHSLFDPHWNMSRFDFAWYLIEINGWIDHTQWGEIDKLPSHPLDELDDPGDPFLHRCCCFQRARYAFEKDFMLKKSGVDCHGACHPCDSYPAPCECAECEYTDMYRPWDRLTREELFYAAAVLLGYDPNDNDVTVGDDFKAEFSDWEDIGAAWGSKQEEILKAVAYLFYIDNWLVGEWGGYFVPTAEIDRANIASLAWQVVERLGLNDWHGDHHWSGPGFANSSRYYLGQPNWNGNNDEQKGWTLSPQVTDTVLMKANELVLELEHIPDGNTINFIIQSASDDWGWHIFGLPLTGPGGILGKDVRDRDILRIKFENLSGRNCDAEHCNDLDCFSVLQPGYISNLILSQYGTQWDDIGFTDAYLVGKFDLNLPEPLDLYPVSSSLKDVYENIFEVGVSLTGHLSDKAALWHLDQHYNFVVIETEPGKIFRPVASALSTQMYTESSDPDSITTIPFSSLSDIADRIDLAYNFNGNGKKVRITGVTMSGTEMEKATGYAQLMAILLHPDRVNKIHSIVFKSTDELFEAAGKFAPRLAYYSVLRAPITAATGELSVIINQAYGTGINNPFEGAVSHSFVELYNQTNQRVSLDGWKLILQNGRMTSSDDPGLTDSVTVSLTGYIEPRASYLILVNKAFDAELGHVIRLELVEDRADIVVSGGFMLSNRAFSVKLENASGGTVDLLGATNTAINDREPHFTQAEFDGVYYEGKHFEPISQQAAARRIGFRDTNNNARDFERIDYRTSGLSDDGLEEKRPRYSDEGAWGLDISIPLFTDDVSLSFKFHDCGDSDCCNLTGFSDGEDMFGGIFNENFCLMLDSGTLSDYATVWYTLDGSDPVPFSNNPFLRSYTGPININDRADEENFFSAIGDGTGIYGAMFKDLDWGGGFIYNAPEHNVLKGNVIKAQVFFADGTALTDPVTRTYIVNDKATLYNHFGNLPVISVSYNPEDLFSEARGIFLNADERGAEWERPGHMEFFEPGGNGEWESVFSQSLGTRIHGGWSRMVAQKSMRYYASASRDPNNPTVRHDLFAGNALTYEGEPIVEFRRFLLRNFGNDGGWGALMRDKLLHTVYEGTNTVGQGSRYAVVMLNGEYWGLYEIRERIDEHFLNSKYNLNSTSAINVQNPMSRHEGSDWMDYPEAEFDKFMDIYNWFNTAFNGSKAHYDIAQTYFDIDNLIDYYIIQTFSDNADWPQNNHNVWRFPTAEYAQPGSPLHPRDGRWRFVLRDLDFGLGIYGKWEADINRIHDLARGINNPNAGMADDSHWSATFFRKLCLNKEFVHRFVTRYLDILNTHLHNNNINRQIDVNVSEIEMVVEQMGHRWDINRSKEDYHNHQIAHMKSWVNRRHDFVLNSLRSIDQNIFKQVVPEGASIANLTLEIIPSGNGINGHIRVNDMDITAATPNVSNPANWTGRYLTGVQMTITAIPAEGYKAGNFMVNGTVRVPDENGKITVTMTGDTAIQVSFSEQDPPPNREFLAFRLTERRPVQSELATDGLMRNRATLRFVYATGAAATFNTDAARTHVNIANAANGWYPAIGNQPDPATPITADNAAGWIITLDTRNYENIDFSAEQGSSNNGPRDFKLAYRTDPEAPFVEIPGSLTLTTVQDALGQTFNGFRLPAAIEDLPFVQLKVYIATTATRSGSGVLAANNGNISMNNIVFAGDAIDDDWSPPVPAPTPNAPMLAANTSTSVTLQTIVGAEYGINTTNAAPSVWQETELFDDLTPGVTYFFFARIKETLDNDASSASPSLRIVMPGPEAERVFTAFRIPSRTQVSSVSASHGSATLEFIYATGSMAVMDTESGRTPVNVRNTPHGWFTATGDDNVGQRVPVASTPFAPNIAAGWIITLDTRGHSNILFSADQGSSNSGPRDFRLAYRTSPSGDFEEILDSLTLTTAMDSLGPTFDRFRLPAGMENQEFVQLKIYISSNAIRSDGSFSLQAHNGNVSINNIVFETMAPAPPAPNAPTMASRTDVSITLDTITGAEYRMVSPTAGQWQDSTAFAGLSPNTGYTFVARIKETVTTLASGESSVSSTITTDRTAVTTPPPAPTMASRTHISITLNTITGAEYGYNTTNAAPSSWQEEVLFEGLTPGVTYFFFARMKETETHAASPASSPLSAATKAASPSVSNPIREVYYASASSGNTVDLAALLPANRGVTSYDTPSYSGAIGSASVNAAGLLTFATDITTVGASETITVVATMANYADTTITVTVSFVDKFPVVIDNLTMVSTRVFNNAASAHPAGTAVFTRDGSTLTLAQMGPPGQPATLGAPVYTGLSCATPSDHTPDVCCIPYGPVGTAPTNAGTYTVTRTLSSPTHQGVWTSDFTITRANQTGAVMTITPASFNFAPELEVTLGVTRGTGTAANHNASGEVTYAVVDDPAGARGTGTIAGTVLTVLTRGNGTIIISATRSGGENFNDVTVQRTITVARGTQEMTVTATPEVVEFTEDSAKEITPTATVTLNTTDATGDGAITYSLVDVTGRGTGTIGDVNQIDGTATLTVTNAGNGTIVVRATKAACESFNQATSDVTIRLAPRAGQPTAITAANINPFTIVVSWPATPGAVEYQLWRLRVNPDNSLIDGEEYKHVGTSETTTFTDRTIAPNTRYRYAVVAIVNIGGADVRSQRSPDREMPALTNINTSAPIPAIPTVAARQTELDISWPRIVTATGYTILIPGVGEFTVEHNNPTNANGTAGGTTIRHKIDTGLTPLTSYVVMVRANWDVNSGNYSAGRAFTTTGPAPGGLTRPANTGTAAAPTLVLQTPTQVTLRWNRITPTATVQAPTGYIVYRGTDKIETIPHDTVTNPATYTHTDPYRIPGEPLVYTVRAYWGDIENTGNAATLSATPGAVPTGVTGISQTPTGFTVRWARISGALANLNESGLDGYNVYVNGEMAGFVGIGSLPLPATYTQPVVGLSPVTTYRVQVAGVWNGVEGRLSNPVNVTTTGPAPGGLARPAHALDGTTANASPVRQTNTSVTLRWNRITTSPAPTGYVIFKDNNSIPIGELSHENDRDEHSNRTPLNTYTFIDADATPGVSARYEVRAYWDTQEYLGNAATMTFTPPGAAPGNVRSIASTRNSITIAWNAVASAPATNPSITRYNVYLDNKLIESDVNGLTHTVTGLDSNTQYQVRVAAVWDNNEDGEKREGIRSNPVSVTTTENPAPINLRTSVAATGTSVTLTWNEPSGNNASNVLEIRGWVINKDGTPYIYLPHTSGTEAANRTWQDPNLVPGLPVRYSIQALWGDEGWEPDYGMIGVTAGKLSNILTVTPQRGLVTGVRTIPAAAMTPANTPNPTPTTLTVDWFGVANEEGMTVAGYNVYLMQNGNVIEGQTKLNVPVVAPSGSALPTATRQGPVTFNGLLPNTVYQVTVQPVWFDGTGNIVGRLTAAANMTRTTNPGTGNITRPATHPTTSATTTLRWSRVEGADGYLIRKGTGSNNSNMRPYEYVSHEEFIKGTTPNHDIWTDSVDNPGWETVRYSVQVFWETPNIDALLLLQPNEQIPAQWLPGATSSVLSFIPPGPAPTGLAIARNQFSSPLVPGNVDQLTQTSVQLTWNLAAHNATNLNNCDTHGVNAFVLTKYIGTVEIDRFEVSRESVQDLTNINRFSLTDTDLNPGLAVRYRVRSLYEADISGDIVTGGRPGIISGFTNVTPPGGTAPAGLSVVAGSLTGTGVRLRWTAVPNSNVTGYRVNRTIDGVTTIVAEIDNTQFISNGNGWTDTELRPGIQAQYTVQALWNTGGDVRPGNNSSRLTVNPPGAAPGSVRGVVTSPSVLTVSWNPVPDVAGASVTYYRIDVHLRSTGVNGTPAATMTVASTERTAVFNGSTAYNRIDPLAQYIVRVTPIWNDDLTGRPSSNINVNMTGPAPAGLSAFNTRHDSTHLTWTAPAGVPGQSVQGYRIIRTIGTTITTIDVSVSEFNKNGFWIDSGLASVPTGTAVRYQVRALWAWEGDPVDGTGSKPGNATPVITVNLTRP